MPSGTLAGSQWGGLEAQAGDSVGESMRRGVRLGLLNSFQLIDDGRPVALPRPAKRLLAFLALHDHPLLRGYVAGTLWLDSTEERASGSLRSALWRLRRPGCVLVEASNHQLRLSPEVVVDFREADALAHHLANPMTELNDVELGETLLAGDLLPDWYDDWVVIERERFRQLRVQALEALCERLTAMGRFPQAVEAGLTAMRGDPLRETTHRALIKLYLAEGNRAEALHQYAFFRQLLHDRLGLEPSSEMKGLIGPITN